MLNLAPKKQNTDRKEPHSAPLISKKLKVKIPQKSAKAIKNLKKQRTVPRRVDPKDDPHIKMFKNCQKKTLFELILDKKYDLACNLYREDLADIRKQLYFGKIANRYLK